MASIIAQPIQPPHRHCITDGLQTREPASQPAKSANNARRPTRNKQKKVHISARIARRVSHRQLQCRIFVSTRDTPLILRVENPIVSPYDRDWYLGWAMPENLIDIWLTQYDGNRARSYPTTVQYERLAHHIKRKTGCRTVRLVLAELTSYHPWPSENITRPGEKAIAFYAIARNSLEDLPSKEQMGKLFDFFGAEPWWAMDAREKHEEPTYNGLHIPLWHA